MAGKAHTAAIGGAPGVDRLIARRERVQGAIARLAAYPKDNQGAANKLKHHQEELANINAALAAAAEKIKVTLA